MAGFTRRDLIVLGSISAAMIGWQRFRRRRPVLEFAPLRDAPGWRFASTGAISGLSGSDFMTIGLETQPEPLPLDQLGQTVHRDAQPNSVPVAVFSDFFCPYCRDLIARLNARRGGRAISITWHELPLLGQNSVLVAQAAEAAALQKGYETYYAQLRIEGFRPSVKWMQTVATKAGLDGQRLGKDLDSDDVAARLTASGRAAAQLGIYATPGIAIGQHVVLGALDTEDMEQLISTAAFSSSPV